MVDDWGTVTSWALFPDPEDGPMLAFGAEPFSAVKASFDMGLTDDGVAFFYCQLDHDHDADSCIPANVTLGDE